MVANYDLVGILPTGIEVLRRVPSTSSYSRWACVCPACKREFETSGLSLRRGKIDCGCGTSARISAAGTRHGHKSRTRRSPEYICWMAMRQRCLNPKHRHYRRYGGRGITVCRRWARFENFLADMGPRPSSEHTLGRVKNGLGYSPVNCKWMTREEQTTDRSDVVKVTLSGERLTIAQWCRRFNIRQGTVAARRRRGWSWLRALTTPAAAPPEVIKVATRDLSTIGRSNVRRSKAHERWVAHRLTEWSGVTFRRRRTEGRGQEVTRVEGAADVIAVGTTHFNFSVEAKCGADFSLNALLANPSITGFTSWWCQATYDANLLSGIRGRKIYPLLFFRPYPGCNWVAFPLRVIPILRGPGHVIGRARLWFPHLIYVGYSTAGLISSNVSHSKKHKQIIELNLDDVVFCRWEDFSVNIAPASTFQIWPLT